MQDFREMPASKDVKQKLLKDLAKASVLEAIV